MGGKAPEVSGGALSVDPQRGISDYLRFDGEEEALREIEETLSAEFLAQSPGALRGLRRQLTSRRTMNDRRAKMVMLIDQALRGREIEL